MRAVPTSRQPGFSKNQLITALGDAGLSYLHFPALGNPKPGRTAANKGDHATMEEIYHHRLDQDPLAEIALEQLARQIKTSPGALMCLEHDPDSCHRNLLARAHVLPMDGGGRRIRIRTAKRKAWVSIPVTPEMGRIIDETPADQALILTTPRGRPWTVVRLSGQVGAAIKKAEGINTALRLYDARGTAATRLVRAGVDLAGIAAIMGWKINTVAHILEVYATLEGSASNEVLVRLEEYKARTKL